MEFVCVFNITLYVELKNTVTIFLSPTVFELRNSSNAFFVFKFLVSCCAHGVAWTAKSFRRLLFLHYKDKKRLSNKSKFVSVLRPASRSKDFSVRQPPAHLTVEDELKYETATEFQSVKQDNPNFEVSCSFCGPQLITQVVLNELVWDLKLPT